ncbi:MAG: GMC family oxidoreductase [Deltaproteobacteria bacterium]|nr:GMC family oxidoreductase [Deltaproteobacteria bacterium]
MIFDAAKLPLPARLRADLVVVGSGPGGASAAMVAAEGGLRVLVLEAGDFVTPASMTQREEQMIPRLLWRGGAQTTSDRAIRVHQGRGIGGSSLHNLNLVKRIPEPIQRRWRDDFGVEVPWEQLYPEVEQALEVSEIPQTMWSAHNLVLKRGSEELGWSWGALSHNRTGCIGSGFCELGCAYDAKNNALKVMVPRIVKAGGEILYHAQAAQVLHGGGRARGVEGFAMDARTNRPLGRFVVDAERVCLAGSATHTAALLMRSRAPDPTRRVGRTLHLHPAVIAAGEMPEPVRAFEGTPQSLECKEWLDFEDDDRRVWIVPAFGHPMGVATMLPGHGAAHLDWMKRYDHMAVLTGMLHDRTNGGVEPDGDFGFQIDYVPDEPDRRQLAMGLARCAELLFAAGAKRVLIPARRPLVLTAVSEARELESFLLTPDSMELSSVHPMGSVGMGDGRFPVRSDGRFRTLDGLWISDGSVFPTSIGVPPQLSIYAIGLHVGRSLLRLG